MSSLRRERSRVQVSDLRGEDFGLFRGLLVGIPWAAVKGSTTQYSLSLTRESPSKSSSEYIADKTSLGEEGTHEEAL